VTGEGAAACRAYQVREWLRVSCPDLSTAAVQLVGGEAKDVYFHIEPQHSERRGLPGGGEFVAAIRKEETRVIQFWTFGPGYDGPLTVIGSVVFQQVWSEEQAEPTLILADVLHEPVRTKTQEGK
jgi:hypothetical protein